jgi:ABC-type transport system substrate-binding protein
MSPSTWARWIAPGLVVVAVLLAAGSPASAQGTHLKVALQGDTSDVDLHMTTHYGLTPRPDADVYDCQTNESATSNAGFKNAEYDRLCKAGRQTVKVEERAKIYTELEQLRRVELPYFPTIYIPRVAAWREGVKGFNHWAAGYARVWGVTK